MVKKISVKTFANYKAHSVNGKGVVKLTVSIAYADLSDAVKLLQLLNSDVNVRAKFGNEKPIKIGSFKIDKFAVDRDGNVKLTFNSFTDYVELDMIANLITEDDTTFVLGCDGEVELEDDVKEESENE